jgi:hypothetical protein
MRNKNTKPSKTKVSSSKKRKETQTHEYETMSQIQNRYGKDGSIAAPTEAVMKEEEVIINL